MIDGWEDIVPRTSEKGREATRIFYRNLISLSKPHSATWCKANLNWLYNELKWIHEDSPPIKNPVWPKTKEANEYIN